jgi:hypothetical protein
MQDNKYGKFYVDWWNIRRSTIYGVIAIIIVIGSVIGGLSWASRNNWFMAADTADIPKDAARIVSFEGEVRITRAATRETILVTRETYVMAGDTIQTQSDGRAIVQMIDGSIYSVRPNSTVVIRDTTSLFGGKNVRVRLNDGQLNVRTEEQPDDVRNIVEVAETENRLLGETDASFDANEATNGGEIRISKGGVETTLDGRTTTLGANEYAAISGAQIAARERLMNLPRPASPANLEQVVDPSGRGVAVGFSWQDPENFPGAKSHLQVARTPTFAADSILVDRSGMATRDFRLAGLQPGTYYWRLKSTARSGQTTSWSDAWKFTVVRGGGEAIAAGEWKVDSLGGPIYTISGRTQPGTAVRAPGRPPTFAAADGTFSIQVSSSSGEVTIDIADDRGNRSGYSIALRTGQASKRY